MKSKLKKLLNSKIREYVGKNKDLQSNIVIDWAGDAEIKTYHIKNSEVTLSNVNLLQSSIIGCTFKESNNNLFTNAQLIYRGSEE